MLPTPTFVGFFPKRTALSNDTIKAEGVERIASVSNCISEAPPSWIEEWLHNDLGFYDTEEQALPAIGADKQPYDLYAYEAYPLRWYEDGREEWNPRSAPGSIPPSYSLLGLDVVTRDLSDFFECSPLSCNGAHEEFAVNAECLIAEESVAADVVVQMVAAQAYEPGYYHLVRVYRRRS